MDNIISIHKTFYKVADFISWKKRSGLLLSPNFQRRSVWDKGAKSFLIDSIIKNLPIPIIFLRDRGIDTKTFEPKREVIDGQQRLRTVISFVAPDLLDDFNPNKDSFTVKKAHNAEIAGKTFDQLDDSTKEKILNYEFNVHIMPSNVDDRDIIQIFRRMNSTNYTLNKQELLNSQFFGEFKTSQYLLAAEQLERWREWKTFTEDDIARMQEVEITTELCLTILEKKLLGKSFTLIQNYYKKYDEVFQHRVILEERFRNTMDFIYSTFVGNKNDYVFFKKTIFYTLFAVIYDLLYGFDESLNQSVKMQVISPIKISDLKIKSDRLKERTAPETVLDATDRRTTNPKERELLFKYLKF